MSVGKASENQTQGTSAPDDDLRAPDYTHRDANALKDGMSMSDTQPGEDSHNFEGKQAAEQRRKARTTPADRASEPRPETRPEFDADAFTTALTAVPVEDWGRTWAADRTIMLRMTSKRVGGQGASAY